MSRHLVLQRVSVCRTQTSFWTWSNSAVRTFRGRGLVLNSQCRSGSGPASVSVPR